jgi:hypothetical protein
MINVCGMKDPNIILYGLQDHTDIGYSAVFDGYKKHQNGLVSLAEQNKLIQNAGDIIVALNDNDMLGVAFEDVRTILKDMAANSNDGVKFRMMDKTLLTARCNNSSQVGHSTAVSNGTEGVLQNSTSSQAGHVTAVSVQPERALPSSTSSPAGHTTEAATFLVNTDDEEDDYPDTIGTSFRLQHLQHGQGAQCVCCNITILDTVNCTSCDSCHGMMHGKCAFHALEQDAFAIFCTRCSNGKRQFHKGLLDMKLSATLGRTPGTTYDY